MRLLSTAARRYTKFRDEVRIDFRQLPDGIIAIVGNNGECKTALLEIAPGAIWRDLPSRPGSMVDYFTDRDGFLECEFEIPDQGAYRARVTVDALGRESQAVLALTTPAGDTRLLTDGKVSSFDQWVREHLPLLDVFLSSAFAAQFRRRGFPQADRKTRREIICEVLAFGRYTRMAQAARAAAAAIEVGRLELTARRRSVLAGCSDEVHADLARRAAAEETLLANLNAQEGPLSETLARLTTDAAALADGASAYTEAVQRQRECQAEVRTTEREIAANDTRETAAREQQRREITQIGKDRDRIVVELAATLADVGARAAVDEADKRKRLINNQALLAGADAIRQAQQDATRLEQEIAEVTRADADARAAVRQLEHARDHLRQQVTTLDRVDTQLTRDRQAAALLSNVPCGGAGEFASCALLRDAQAAAGRIPDLETQVAGLVHLHASVAELDAQIADGHTADQRRGDALRQRQAALAAARDRAKGADRLGDAEGRITELAAAIDQIPAFVAQQHAAAEAHAATRRAALEESIRDADERAFTAIDACAAAARALALQFAGQNQALIDVTSQAQALAPAAGRLEEVQREITATTQAQATLVAQIARVEERAAAIARERVLFDRRRAEVKAIDEAIVILDSELIEWETLARVFGPQGLPPLEIDAAGPALSALTNQLLEVSAGGRYTVDFVTQEARADGKGVKEIFELRVLDNRDGGNARDVGAMSGGQQALIMECLMSAIAIYVNTTSPMPIQTLWRDETSSALDEENRAAFIPMLRKVAELGGFRQVLLITHDEDIKAQADAQIRVHDGTAEIVHAPFDRQEAA